MVTKILVSTDSFSLPLSQNTGVYHCIPFLVDGISEDHFEVTVLMSVMS